MSRRCVYFCAVYSALAIRVIIDVKVNVLGYFLEIGGKMKKVKSGRVNFCRIRHHIFILRYGAIDGPHEPRNI